MRKLCTVLLLPLLLLSACRRPATDGRHEEVRAAAEEYYGHLANGDAAKCVSSLCGHDAMSEEYRSQMRDLFAQYVERECVVRGGIVDAVVTGDTIIDSLNACVFVEITFGDDTKEVSSLPMRLADGKWMLR